MAWVLLSIASFSSKNRVNFFWNVREKLPAPLLGLDSYGSTMSTLLFPLKWGTNNLIFTGNNEKPPLDVQEMLRCIWPLWRSRSRSCLVRSNRGEKWCRAFTWGGTPAFLEEVWVGILLNLRSSSLWHLYPGLRHNSQIYFSSVQNLLWSKLRFQALSALSPKWQVVTTSTVCWRKSLRLS